MKKYFLSLLFMAGLLSCGGGDKKEGGSAKETNTTENSTSDVSKNPDYQKGLELIAQSDCLTCHKVDEKITGPAYREVANKYAGMPDTIVSHLAGKIISGGSGVWGDVMMLPHPNLSKEDAEAMVKYILLLKK